MEFIGWVGFGIIFFLALVTSGILIFFQQKRYIHEVNRAVEISNGPTDVLLTGRGKGIFQGAIVVLVLDKSTENISYVKVMKGATVFAKFKSAPEFLGNHKQIVASIKSKTLKKAFESALENMSNMPASRPDKNIQIAKARKRYREHSANN